MIIYGFVILKHFEINSQISRAIDAESSIVFFFGGGGTIGISDVLRVCRVMYHIFFFFSWCKEAFS